MTAYVHVSPPQRARRLAVLIAALIAPVVGYGQMMLGWGQTPAEFAADGDETLRVAGYAFSIWALIYGWLLVHAIWQAMRRTEETPLLGRLGWPSFAALVGVSLWIVAVAADWKTGTVVLIAASALALTIPMLLNACLIRHAPSRDSDRWLVAWPLGLLAGWLTFATAGNVLTVLTSQNALPAALSPTAWAIVAVALVAVATLLVVWSLRLTAFPLPVGWGLIAVFAAEQDHNQVLAFTALGAALLVLFLSLVMVFRLKPEG